MAQFIVKVLCFALVVLGAQWALGTVWPNALERFPFETRLKTAAGGKIPVLYMGDSVITAHGRNETGAASITAEFEKLNPQFAVTALDHAAMQPAIQWEILRWARKQGGFTHKLLILPVNLRAFSVTWRMNRLFQFSTQRVALKADGVIPDAWVRPLFVWKFCNAAPISPKDYEFAYQRWSSEYAPGLSKYPPKKLQFTESYHFKLNDQDEMISYLQAILREQRAVGRSCLVYLTPVDVESAAREGGPEVRESLKYNAEFIRKICEKDAVFLDLHDKLGPDAFVWQEEARVSEHLNNAGREFVVKEVNNAVREILKTKTESK